jgi:hypothetical protein
LGDLHIGLKYGEFGEVNHETSEMTSQNDYNMELSFKVIGAEMKELGVICDEYNERVLLFSKCITPFNWIMDEVACAVLDNVDDINAQACPYKL